MKINRIEFLNSLQPLSMAISSKEILEQSASFVFKDRFVYAFNGELAAKAPIAPIELFGAVRAVELLAILSKYKDKEINIETTDKELLISTRRSKAGIVMQAKITLPLDVFEEEKKWQPLPDTFSVALKSVLFTATTDLTQPELSCVHIHGDIIETSDNFRITRKTLEGLDFSKPVLIPIESALPIVKNQPIAYCMDASNNWIHFDNEHGISVSVRLANGTFPNVDPFLKAEGTPIEFPKEMIDVLNRAIVFAGNDEESAERFFVTLENNYIKIRGESKYGWFEEKTPMKYDKETISFHTYPAFLKDMLNRSTEALISDAFIQFSVKDFVHCCSIMV